MPAGPAVYLSAQYKQMFAQAKHILTQENGKGNRSQRFILTSVLLFYKTDEIFTLTANLKPVLAWIVIIGNITLNQKTYELSSPSGSYKLANKEFQMLEQLVSILLDNAVKYSRDGSTLTITVLFPAVEEKEL